MDWHIIIGILAGVIQVYAVIPYIKEILHGDTRPNIVSWGLWTFIQIVAIMVLLSSAEGFSWSLVLLLATTFNTGLVTILCLKGYGYKQFGLVEKICLPLSLVTVACWVITKDPVLTLALDVLAYFVADLPTIIKTWKDPHSETAFPWFLVAVAATLGALSSTIINAENLALPIYLALANGTIALFAYVGQKRRPKPMTA